MLEQILTGNPQQEVVNFLAGDSLLGNAKSKPLWPLLLQKPNMLLLQAAVGKIQYIIRRQSILLLGTTSYEMLMRRNSYRKSWPLFKSKKIAQVVRAWIQSKNSLVKHFEDMRLCRPSKEYLPVWFDPPRDESMSCLTTKGMRNNGAMCASIPDTYIVHSLFGQRKLVSTMQSSTAGPKFATAKVTLEKHTRQGSKSLISLYDDLSLLSNMAALESCPKHNMIAYLEKTEGNVEFHEVIDFLRRSYIYHALTVSPVVSTTFVEQFWTSAKSKTINNVRHITAKVAGKFRSSQEIKKLLKAKITKLKKPAKPVIKLTSYLKTISSAQSFPRRVSQRKHRGTKSLYPTREGRLQKENYQFKRSLCLIVMPRKIRLNHGKENAQSEGGKGKWWMRQGR
ncbi:hypothetical protein Tco_0359145 [Tanacetum coccineum]